MEGRFALVLLAIDTATPVAGVALADESKILFEIKANLGFNHSRTILRMVESMLDLAGIRLGEVDALAVTTGPGSFTGLRIGLATAKGLAMASAKPIIGISTLDALAYNYCWAAPLMCPILNARKSEVYTAFYRGGTEFPERITDYMALSPEDLIIRSRDIIEREAATHMVFTGDGLPVYGELLETELGALAKCAPRVLAYPSAASAARLAIKRMECGEIDDIYDITPVYVRLSEAEYKLSLSTEHQANDGSEDQGV
ncbi:MAG: tRNA (adenosine(37)-N6)-threonylcarbamoyltransferase complex dimerization subunit type 1 TsaB [Acidobacteriota bacterium]